MATNRTIHDDSPEDDVPTATLTANRVEIKSKAYPDHLILIMRCIDGETLFIGDKTCIAKGKEIRILVAKDSEIKRFIREGDKMTLVISKDDPQASGGKTESHVSHTVTKGEDPDPQP